MIARLPRKTGQTYKPGQVYMVRFSTPDTTMPGSPAMPACGILITMHFFLLSWQSFLEALSQL